MTRKSLIGKNASVTDAKNKYCIGICGTVRDETKNTIRIGDKILVKEMITLKIDGEIIKGKEFARRIQDRIKLR